ATGPPSRRRAGTPRASSLLLLRGRDEPFIREREELVGMNRDPAQLLVIAAVVRQRPEERVRRLLGEERVQLPVDGAPFLVIERQLALHDEAVDLGIRVPAEVVLPRTDLGGMEQRGDVRERNEDPAGLDDVDDK